MDGFVFRYQRIALVVIMSVFLTGTVQAQDAPISPTDRVAEIREVPPSLEDPLTEDTGRWKLPDIDGDVAIAYKDDALLLQIRQTRPGRTRLVHTVSDLSAESMYVEVDVRHVFGDLLNSFGFLVRKSLAEYYVIAVNGQGSFVFQSVRSGDLQQVVPWTASDAIESGRRQKNRLGLLIEGDNAVLFVNGVAVASAEGLAFAGTHLGLVTSIYDVGTAKAAFENLRYWRLGDVDRVKPVGSSALGPRVDVDEPSLLLAAASPALKDLALGFGRAPGPNPAEYAFDSFEPIIAIADEDVPISLLHGFTYLEPTSYCFVSGASGVASALTDTFLERVHWAMPLGSVRRSIQKGTIGDQAIAFDYAWSEPDAGEFRILIFLRGQYVAILSTVCPQGEQQAIDLDEVAKEWDARLIDYSTNGVPEERDTANSFAKVDSTDETGWSKATVNVEDLPSGYARSTEEYKKAVLSSFIVGYVSGSGARVVDNFSYYKWKPRVDILGVLVEHPADQGGEANAVLENVEQRFTDLHDAALSSFGIDIKADILEQDVLEISSIGDGAVVYRGEVRMSGPSAYDPNETYGFNMVLEVLIFRHEQLFGVLELSHKENVLPDVDLVKVATLWDQRLAELLADRRANSDR